MAIQAQTCSGFGFRAPQDLLMDNACGFNNLCPKQDQELAQGIPFIPKNNSSDQQSMAFSQMIATHIESQRIEIDMFINSQNERLRSALQEQRKQHMALFMKKYESKIQFLFRQKEEEIAKAAKRATELQEFLERMEIENQTWRRVARENEAMVASLNSAIERLRDTARNAAEDAESCCLEEEGRAKRQERKARNMVCRRCNSRNSCVIMLPCRHLCACRDCEALLDSCPVCKMGKKASIEAWV